MSRRTERLGSTIQQELALIILRELNDPRLTGMPSITRVKVSPDLAVADVFVTIMGSPGQQNAALNALKHSAGLMRTRLTKSLTLRVAPFIKFHIDEGLKKELEVLELVRMAAEETAENDRRRAQAEAAAASAGISPSAGGPGEGAAASVDATGPHPSPLPEDQERQKDLLDPIDPRQSDDSVSDGPDHPPLP